MGATLLARIVFRHHGKHGNDDSAGQVHHRLTENGGGGIETGLVGVEVVIDQKYVHLGHDDKREVGDQNWNRAPEGEVPAHPPGTCWQYNYLPKRKKSYEPSGGRGKHHAHKRAV